MSAFLRELLLYFKVNSCRLILVALLCVELNLEESHKCLIDCEVHLKHSFYFITPLQNFQILFR